MAGFQVAGDLALSADGRELLLLGGAALAAQQIKIGAETWVGAVAWDPDAGLPMLAEIMVKNPDLRLIAQIFRTFLLDTAGVIDVEELTCDLDRTTRRLRVNFRVRCEDGSSLTDTVAFALA